MTSRDLYKTEGFFMLKSLFTPAEVSTMRAKVLSHLQKHDDFHHRSMGLSTKPGWYIADFPRHEELSGILSTIQAKPKLADALSDLLCDARAGAGASPSASCVQLLHRSEIYVDRVRRSLARGNRTRRPHPL